MNVSTKFDFCKIPNRKRFNARLMVSIQSEHTSTQNNKPLNLALVLDRSGSMRGHKIRYVKEATKILTSRMGKDDFFSLTIFDSEVKTLIPPIKIGKASGIEEAINSITARDTTNLSGGYIQGCDYARENKADENVTRVMLLTDGLANRGITDPGQLVDITSTMQVEGISTTTIGVGENYNEFLLGKMAENGGGGAYFIESPDDAPSVFEEELGYLQSLVATDLELKIVPANDNIRFEQLNTYRVSGTNKYLLGDVYEDQIKSLILEFELPEMEIGQDIEIGHIEVSYRDTTGEESTIKTLKIPVKIDVVSKEDFLKITPDKDVVIAAAYLTVARGKAEAIKLADRREFERAADLLEKYAADIEKLVERYQLNDSRLINDIKELRDRAQNLRNRGEEYYNPIERKRMYYESDMLMKSKSSSYDAMINRRAHSREMFKYPCFHIDGYILAEIGNDKVLIDTGAPVSIGDMSSYTLGSRRFPLQENYLGFDIDDFSRLIGMRISILLGADILNTFDCIIDLKKEKFIISLDSINYHGDVLESDSFHGVPIISAKTDNRSIKLFFDTGSKLSYLKSDIVTDYPAIGQDTDFYPGFGEFQTDIHKLNLSIAGHQLKQRMGTLPQTLEMALSVAGIDGILGTAIFDKFNICLSARRKQIIFQEI